MFCMLAVTISRVSLFCMVENNSGSEAWHFERRKDRGEKLTANQKDSSLLIIGVCLAF